MSAFKIKPLKRLKGVPEKNADRLVENLLEMEGFFEARALNKTPPENLQAIHELYLAKYGIIQNERGA